MSMNRHSLTVVAREVTGKKVKNLRKEGILPANIYGYKTESIAVQLPMVEFMEVYKEVGETGLIDVVLHGKKLPVLIHGVQDHYIGKHPVHADFLKVNLKEKIKTMVSVELIGEAKAVTEDLGVLLHTLSEVEIEALPTDLPEHLEADVTSLAEVGAHILVSDLKAPEGVEILTEGTQTVAKIVVVTVEEEPVAEEAPTDAESVTTEGEATEDTTEAPTEAE